MSTGVLFVAAGDEDAAREAAASRASDVVIDLEDLLPPERRVAARAELGTSLAHRRLDQRWYVRVNGLETDLAFEDLMKATALPVDGIVVPKIEAREQLAIAHWLLLSQELRSGLQAGSLGMIAIIETAHAFPALSQFGGPWAKRLRLGLGTGDLVTDLSLRRTRDEAELGYYRAALAVASRANGFGPPIDSVWIAMDDEEGLRASSLRGAAAGMTGKFCLHPRQAEIISDTLGAQGNEVDKARRIVAAFEVALENGKGSVVVEGEFVDAPIAERYRRLISN